jgi:superfamily II DNA or RNA helicase
MHGIVTTYQQVASSAPLLRELAADAFVIFDEVHHAADDRAWGDSIRVAFETSVRRLAISGTPFRSDTSAIPFVRYVLEEAAPDLEYGYGDALADGRVVRPVYFPRTGGHMEWTAPDGSQLAASFDDALDQARSSQRLRTALSLEGEWLPTVLREAVGRLEELREVQPNAGGLVIAIDQDHARGIAAMLRDRFGQQATVVTSDDPDASARIARFSAGSDPWLVAVRMVSEGVDIPRLRVGVYATTTTTELFFRQAVGRFVRWTPGVKDQKAFLYIPDDPRLRARAFQIADQRRHSLRKREQERFERDPDALDATAEEQLSLFAALSAVATDHQVHAAFELDDVDDDLDPALDDDPTLVLTMAPPPPLSGDRRSLDDLGISLGGEAARTRREEKRRLREQNAEIVATLVRRTGQTHAQVNSELNRLSGVGRITEATVAQLRRRLEVTEQLARR